jgi:hypothetical protein
MIFCKIDPRFIGKFNNMTWQNLIPMNKGSLKKGSLLVLLLTIMPLTACAEIFVGVNQGNWAEYDVAFTGTPIVGHDATWARMEVIDVKETKVSVEFTSLLSDGTQENVTENLNFETGHLIDYFVIPAGLNKGDNFLDEVVGDILISSVEMKTYAGANRNVISGSTLNTLWYWDQATGILVEAHSAYPEYTLTTVITKTNIWKPQILGFEEHIFYFLIITLATIIAIIVIFLAYHRKK